MSRVTLKCVLYIRGAEVCVCDDSLRDAETISKRLEPFGLLDGVFGTDGRLNVDDANNVGKSRFREEVFWPIPLCLNRSPDSDLTFTGAPVDLRVGRSICLQPDVSELRVTQIPKVNVGIDKAMLVLHHQREEFLVSEASKRVVRSSLPTCSTSSAASGAKGAGLPYVRCANAGS